MDIAVRGLTYEDYLCSPEEMRRYDILDGEKIYMTNPTNLHLEVQGNLYSLLRTWWRTRRSGKLFEAPCDVLIRRIPLHVRQPDILYISRERRGTRRGDDPAPMSPAPELVIEILSPSDTRSVLDAKLADYASVNVLECWLVRPGDESVEVLLLRGEEWQTAGVYHAGESAQSAIFDDLRVSVDAVFEQFG